MKKNVYIIVAAFVASLAQVSCSDELVIGKIDKAKYSDTEKVVPYIMDANTGKANNTIELRADDYESAVIFGLNRTADVGVDAVLSYDSQDALEFAREYNEKHGTDFAIYPEELVSFTDEPKVLLAPDEKKSVEVSLRITYSEELEDDRTYILPIRATASAVKDVNMVNEAHSVYLVKNYRNRSNTFKGDDALKTILYFETGDTNPLNALEYIVDKENSPMLFDYVVLFSANINYVNGQVRLTQNPNIEFLLDNNETFIQPLRKRGIKVLLSVLGNWDVSGVAQLSETGAKVFARDLAALCRAYNLDGVSFDDEYSKKPDLSNPLFTEQSAAAAARLCYETKMAMPDKEVCVYAYGNMHYFPKVDGVEPGEFIDILVPDYPQKGVPELGMTKKQMAYNSIQLLYQVRPNEMAQGNSAGILTDTIVARENGYGYVMMFALYAGSTKDDGDAMLKQATICSTVSTYLYDKGIKPVEWFYPKDSATKVPMSSMMK